MTSNETYACPDCGHSARVKSPLATLLVCTQCHAIIQNDTGELVLKRRAPDTWGVLSIGTTGTYKGKSFEVLGRIHLQGNRDYYSFWYVYLPVERTGAWLAESLGVYTFCSEKFMLTEEAASTTLGKTVSLSTNVQVTIDQVEHCQEVSVSGETSGWNAFSSGFSFSVANLTNKVTAFLFPVARKGGVRFLTGEPVDPVALKLEAPRSSGTKTLPDTVYALACPNCGKPVTPVGRQLTRALSCPHCNAYFSTDPKKERFYTWKAEAKPALKIGSTGTFDGVKWQVMGFTQKFVRRHNYKFQEYLLYHPLKGTAYLAEYEGNWNFITPLREAVRRSKSILLDFDYEGRGYRLYQKYATAIVYAQGEFFHDVYNYSADTECEEFISPPYLLSLEKEDSSNRWYEGEYKTPAEIASAFNLKAEALPKKQGRGYIQPFISSFEPFMLIKVCLVIVLLIGTLEFLFQKGSAEKIVFQNTYSVADLKTDQKMLVTPSFDLEGESKSLVVNLSAPISNDWFYGDFSLVNESDQTEYSFSSQVEYYFGSEGGESWSEGSRSGEAFLSRIPAGRYHINIYPEFSPTNGSFAIMITRDVNPMSNMWLALLAVGLFPAYYGIRRYYIERNRWSDSDYSPYDTD